VALDPQSRTERRQAGGVLKRGKPLRREYGEAVEEGAPPGGGQRVRRSLADDLRLHRVGYDQARVGRHEMKREVGVYSEIERIAEIPVLRPLAVGHEIPHARLHLDAGEAAIRTEREDIRTAAVRQRNLVQRGP